MVEVRYSIYLLTHVPRFGGVVEVEVHLSNFNWRRHGRGIKLYLLPHLPRFGVW